MKKIYFDYASTTPTDPDVIQAMEPFLFERFGNAASPHSIGRDAQSALESARETLAKFIGAKAEEIVFNSGGSESNNHAIIGSARALKSKGNHIIVSSIEHPSVSETIDFLSNEGFHITTISVDSFGLINPSDIKKAITNKTILIVAIHANNEIGTIEPIAQIGEIAKEHKIAFLVDAVQSVGHIPVNVLDFNCDYLSFSAHKFYGPKGVGALYIRKGSKIAPFLLGGDQERSHRASTQNVAGAVGMAKAIELCQKNMKDEAERLTKLRDRLLKEIPKRIDGVKINGHLTQRLPKNAHFAFEKLSGESLLMSLDMVGICASMGSACKAGSMEPSRVLRAIGLSDELALGALRISIGRWTTESDIDYLLEQLEKSVRIARI